MLHSSQCLPMMETGYPSLTIHFEILMNKVKPSDLSLIFGGNLVILVIGPYLAGGV